MMAHRLWIAVACLMLGLVTVVCRTVQVMVVNHDFWVQRAARQHQRQISVPNPRGEIRSADGYLLATSVSRVAIQVDTQALEYKDLFAGAAAPLIGATPAELQRRLSQGPRAIWLAQRADRETGLQVRALAPAAVVLVPDSERVYPLGRLAAAVVGFTGREELRTVGRAGLEHKFDTLLTGTPDHYWAVRDAVQRQLRLQRINVNRGRAGYDLELTLNARLQAICEAELEQAVTRFRAIGGSVVVTEAHTGKILALASIPSFDPNRPGEVPPECWRLRPVQDAFEPGSTIKPLVAAAALASPGDISHQLFDCRRRIRVAGRWIRDHADPGIYTLDQVVAQSSNSGIIQVAQQLPPQSLLMALRGFGLGERTGIDFPAEARGLLQPLDRWTAMSPAGISLGQELTVSPLQLALAYAAIANGGWLPRPQLVHRPGTSRSRHQQQPVWKHRVMSRELSQRLSQMLEQVVQEGTGSLAQVPGMRVAGKTGTAQSLTDTGFDDSHHTPWFAGFFPLPAPRFVAVISLENPVEDYWGSSVAAPVFARIAEATARVLGVSMASDVEPEGTV
jgi:cell division protein FtsI/penicillin-binding protein 2